jgi:hypothetical protein
MYKFTLYSPLRSWKKGQPPTNPFVSVAVGAHSTTDGQLLLTSQLMTDLEIDHEVDGLIKEMEEFRKAAKKELRNLRARMLGE